VLAKGRATHADDRDAVLDAVRRHVRPPSRSGADAPSRSSCGCPSLH
jgi:hypothetical protein